MPTTSDSGAHDDQQALALLQQEMWQNERRFQATFEQAAVGMAHVSLDGRFLQVNQKLCDIVGYPRAELQLHRFQDITYPPDLSADLAYVEQLLAGKISTYSMEKRYIRANGMLVWINLTVALVRDQQEAPLYFISVIEDIDERKQVEEALQQERRALSMLTENATDVIARYDRSRRLVYVNPAITAVLGLRPDEVIGKTISELGMSAEALRSWNDAFNQVLAGEVRSLEFSYPSPTAGLCWYQSRLNPELDMCGNVVSVLAINRDVTELKKAQVALIQSEARARRLIDSNVIGVIIADVDHIFEANDAFLDLLGYSREDLRAGRINWRAMTPAEYVSRDEHCLQELRERGVCTPFEKEFTRLDGSRVAVLLGAAEVQADPPQWVCFILDITERQQQERRLQHALNALLTIAEVLDTREEPLDNLERTKPSHDEVARRVLEAICQVLSCEGVVMTKLMPASDIIDTLIMVGFDGQVRQTLLDDAQGKSLAARLENDALVEKLRAGEVVLLDVSKPPYYDRQPRPYLKRSVLVPMHLGDELVGLLSLYPQDEWMVYTREDRALALAIARLAALLIERERLQLGREEAWMRVWATQEVMQQMDEFLGMASHELKTPLTSIQGNLQLVRRQLARFGTLEGDSAPLLNQLSGLLERAERQLKVQNRLINDLLDVSRIHANRLELSPRLIDLTQLVRDVVEDQCNLVPTRPLHFESSVLEIMVNADAERIGQVVNNYLSNALKYSEATSPVNVCVSVHEQMARVEVEDQGPGLTAEQQERIWQRFYRAPDIIVKSGSGVGLGLGLHICRTIIERHSGQVGVKSTPGVGSTFWFTLPIAPSLATDCSASIS
ncbi:hypothetical protein KDA_38650 [Dictyobacter alpinus]|uniref:histidine kinase n=1 Tax=Dictyobacter alpinus TaxID=2014873 RepID=A0A402BAG3_9CHLR|nr:PAS domain-containing sensor histidine kinase [Dictyobacter alpinus]GCE28381.1 hypothetical protein KDA_38650 [Dictyobacter alpinus]